MYKMSCFRVASLRISPGTHHKHHRRESGILATWRIEARAIHCEQVLDVVCLLEFVQN